MIKLIPLKDIVLGPSLRMSGPNNFLLNSIDGFGLQQPLTVFPTPRKGLFWFLKRKTFTLVDGHCRLDACKRLKFPTVACRTITEEQQRAAQILYSPPSYTTPEQRRRAIIILRNNGYTENQIKDLLGGKYESSSDMG